MLCGNKDVAMIDDEETKQHHQIQIVKTENVTVAKKLFLFDRYKRKQSTREVYVYLLDAGR